MATTYSMTPINSGTRKRVDHNTFSLYVNPSVAMGVLVEGNELWEATADGAEVMAGDKWLKLTKVGGVPVTETLWMAYIHKGVVICNNFKTITDPVIPPPTTTGFPEYFDLIDPQGNKARYEFSRILP